jgi:hypothetical protein
MTISVGIREQADGLATAVRATSNAGTGAAHRSQLDFLEALVAASLVSREAADKAAALSGQLAIHVLPGLLRLNAVAELPLYRFYAG